MMYAFFSSVTELFQSPLAFLQSLLYRVPATLIALILHEWAHGFVAYKLGDPTAKMMGRLSLNPLHHLDPLGTVLLFVAGVVFCYLVILHPAFQFFSDQAAGMMDNTARAQSYVDIILKFELGFGFAFELPLIVFYLVIFNVVPYKKLRSAWRGVYVGLLVLSACVTPDASPVTMLLMFAAMVGLYECSLLIARVALRSRIKKQEAQAAADEAELEELKTELSEGFNSLRNDLAGE